ncbi:MAG TPA: TerB family tellurite resistance protein [Gammaproteobacteria bacterium]
MENQESKDWFEDIEAVITDPLKFKAKLAIGEDAYMSLRLKNTVMQAWDTLGVAGTAVTAAKSTAVASTFFAPSGFLAVFGVGTAVTPLGWVVAAGVLTGGAWLGVTRYLKDATSSRTTVIPDFINTPMDVLALALFDFLAPLALKISDVDGSIDESERSMIIKYFVKEWGYDERFVTEGVVFAESKLSGYSIKEVAKALAEFKNENPDCNYKSMSKEILRFLQNLIESDGKIDEREEMAIDRIKAIFDETGKFSLKKTAMNRWKSIKNISTNIISKNIVFGKKNNLDN